MEGFDEVALLLCIDFLSVMAFMKAVQAVDGRIWASGPVYG